MFGIGTTEILVILVVALVVIGPESLPKMARTFGKALGEFRKVSTEFQRTLNTEIAIDEYERNRKTEVESEPEAEPEVEVATKTEAEAENTSDTETKDKTIKA